MEKPEIRLELNENTNREELIGMNGEMIPDERIIAAVNAHRRIFPYVVKHIAINRMLKDDTQYVDKPELPPPNELLLHMCNVRDELLNGLESLSITDENETVRQIMVDNMTRNVKPQRSPYFVR